MREYIDHVTQRSRICRRHITEADGALHNFNVNGGRHTYQRKETLRERRTLSYEQGAMKKILKELRQQKG